MKLSETLSILKKDWQLINMTASHKFPPDIKEGLEKQGWQQEKVIKTHCYGNHYGVAAVMTYEDKEYVRGRARQGSAGWYDDLAKLTLPNHKPSILTKVLG